MLKESVASLKCRTGKGKEVGVEVAVSGTSTTKSAGQNRCRVTKIAFAVLVVALLLGGVISAVIVFQQKRSSTRLADVHLEEGDTLVYRVDQNLEVRGGHIQKGNISSMVGIQVLNKTSDEYWFIIKINITIKSGSVGVKGLTAAVMDYFLVRLQISDPRSDTVNAHGDNGTNDEPFELYGNQTTDEEFIRFVYGVLDQLLPVVRRDLYEEVNGIKGNTDKKPRVEKSPLLPCGVRMHRAANTSDKNAVYIKNRFDRADLVNASSEIDMDMRYSGSASINKSNGMVSESHAYLSERLYFGEPIRTKSGSDVTMMDIAFSSHVSLIETNSGYFTIGERAQIANLGLFVKLIVRAEASVSVEKPDWDDDQFNSSRNLSNDSVFTDWSSTSTPPPSPLKRSRRGYSARNQGWNKLNKQSLQKPVDITRTLFEKKVVGIKVKGGVRLELRANNNGGFYMTVSSTLSFGSYSVRLFRTRHDDREIKSGKTRRVRYNWEKGISIEVPVYFLSLGVEVSLWIPVTIELSFPRTSPHNLAVQIPVSPKVSCINCLSQVPMDLMRKHEETCVGGSSATCTLPIYSDSDTESPSGCKKSNASKSSSSPTPSDLNMPGPSTILSSDEKLDQLMEMFPARSISCLRECLAQHGTVASAALSLSASLVAAGDDSGDDRDLEDPVFLPRSTETSLQSLLQQLQKNLSSDKEKLKVDEEDLLNDAMAYYKDESFDPKKKLRIIYKGQPAADTGGVVRQFFTELLDTLSHEFFHGLDYKSPIYNSNVVACGMMKLVGTIIVHSILQGGPGFPVFSPSVYHYLATGDLDAAMGKMTLNDCSARTKHFILQVAEAVDVSEIGQEETTDMLSECGLTVTLTIEPSVAVTTSIKGYVSVFFLRGGIYGDGTLVRASLPVTLSYQAHRGRQLCLALSARVTALELEAGIFYQWKSCRFSWFWITCDWGDRKTLISFGRWAAFKKQWKLAETCF